MKYIFHINAGGPAIWINKASEDDWKRSGQKHKLFNSKEDLSSNELNQTYFSRMHEDIQHFYRV